MKNELVVFNKTELVGVITINSEATENTIQPQMIIELTDICNDIRFDETVRVVVITGAGKKFFCTGPDLNNIVSNPSNQEKLLSISSPVASLTCPTIAAMNGDVLGQGLELALACDIRIGVEGTCFGLPHLTAGLIPWDGATQRLQRIVGITKAMEMVLMAETLDAKEALRIGLISKLVTQDELLPVVMAFANSMSAQSPLALKIAKEAITKGMDLTLEQGLHLEADLYFLLHTTNDRTEGINAFKEKRDPRFKGS
jgi:enoyl-CoA hydratase/carnithine racemase